MRIWNQSELGYFVLPSKLISIDDRFGQNKEPLRRNRGTRFGAKGFGNEASGSERQTFDSDDHLD